MAKAPRSITSIFVLLCCINILNYIGRGIIPGAPIQFQAFIQQTLHVDPANVSVYIGLLVSTFIAAYSIFICVFGYLAIHTRPFFLISIGLCIWIASSILAGVSKSTQSFVLLLCARLLGGIGESAFQAIMPSFIDQYAPHTKRTFWLGLFGCAISAGTALGYTYGSLTAQSIGWDIGYYIVGAIMVPLALFCYRYMPKDFDHPMSYDPTAATAEMLMRCLADRDSIGLRHSVSVFGEMGAILRTPLFLTSAFGLAAYTFTLAGIGSFGPVILIGTGILDEKICATVFGAMVVLSGLVGAPLGGFLVDYQCRGRATEADYRLYIATRQMAAFVSFGIFFAFLSWCFIDSPVLFLFCMFVFLTLMFMTQSAQSVSILHSVSHVRRGFATGLSTCICHVVGDVPSPIILGWLKDELAPDCGSLIDANGHEHLNPACVINGKHGLKQVLLFAFLWLGWSAFMWGLSFFIARKQLRRQAKCVVLFDPFTNTPVLSA